MGVFSKICVMALAAGYMGAEASAVSVTDAPERVLRAATKRSDLQRRSHRIEPKFASEIIYIEREFLFSFDERIMLTKRQRRRAATTKSSPRR